LHKLDVAFCDTNETYGERFAAYLMEHKAKEFTVHLFPEPELFLQKIKNEKFDLVLLGSGFSEFGEQAVLSGMTVLILSENIPERLSEDNSYLQSGRKLTVIFKYQPMEAILHEMMVVTGGKKAGKESFTDRLTKLEIIGVYSPIGHEMQMPFSMVLSSVLAKQRRILYINLMQNTGFLQLFDSQAEYDIRKAEAIRYVKALGLDFIDGDYDYQLWRSSMSGMEDEPERGGRCLQCFTLRLTETARYAAEHGFTLFTTTLASSRWKSLDQINLAGRRAAALYPGTIFWEQNWRKGGLQDRRNQLLKEHDFYNQQYCGCEFSMRRLEEKE